MDKDELIGILQPQMAYRFRLRATGAWLTEEEHQMLTCQTVSVGIDYLNKKLTVVIRQNANSTVLHEALVKMFERDVVILHVDAVDGSGSADPVYILEFDCKAKAHDFAYDYANTSVAQHTIEFEFSRMLPYNKKEEEVEEVE